MDIQAIAKSKNCLQPVTVFWPQLELCTNFGNVHIQCARAEIGGIAPDALHYVPARERPLKIVQEQQCQRKLFRGQFYGISIERHRRFESVKAIATPLLDAA